MSKKETTKIEYVRYQTQITITTGDGKPETVKQAIKDLLEMWPNFTSSGAALFSPAENWKDEDWRWEVEKTKEVS